MQKDFSLAAFLSEKEERSMWNQESTFPDESILDRYLSSRALCVLGTAAWPLVFDPYDQLEKYLRVSGGGTAARACAICVHVCTCYMCDVNSIDSMCII